MSDTSRWLEWEDEWRRREPTPERYDFKADLEAGLKDGTVGPIHIAVGKELPPLRLPRVGEVAMTTEHAPFFPPDHPIWNEIKDARDLRPVTFADILEEERRMQAAEAIRFQEHGPRLWDSKPDMVTHIAGTALTVFGIFMRQRCDWCGIVLAEYDLRRVAVPIGQPGLPAMWVPGSLVRIDGHMSAMIHDPAVDGNEVQIPMDSCCFDPETQIGYGK